MAANRTIAAAAMGLAFAFAVSNAVGAEGDLVRGEKLYNLCTQCHGDAGAGNALALAPAIAGLPQWYVDSQLHKFYAGIRGTHPDDVGGMRMRPMALSLYDHGGGAALVASDFDIAAVAAYVASLPPIDPEPVLSGGDPARGKITYTLCLACHGPDGAGNEQLQSPPIANANDWYLLTQLQNFKAGVRGARPGDASGATMRPMAMTLADEQAMKDVIAYIFTLGEEQ